MRRWTCLAMILLAATAMPMAAGAVDGGSSASLADRAEQLRLSGHITAAGELLAKAVDEAERRGDTAETARLLNDLGSLRWQAGAYGDAKAVLARALSLAEQLGDKPLRAAALGNLATVAIVQGDAEEAKTSMAAALAAADQAGDPALMAPILINTARKTADSGQVGQAAAQVRRVETLLPKLPRTGRTAELYTAAGSIFEDAYRQGRRPQDLASAYQAYTRALTIGDALGEQRTRSYALGFLGRLYQFAGRGQEALDLTTRSIAAAESVGAPELLYRWHWQQGRLRAALGDRDSAIASYRNAVAELQSARGDLGVRTTGGASSFRTVFGPIYYELADLLLRQAPTATGEVERVALLSEARETVELSKSAELQDYFEDSCVASRSSSAKVTEVEKGTAVVYPFILPDRLELIVAFDDQLEQFTVPVTAAQVNGEVHDFRGKLEKRATSQYLKPARQLYDWIVRPMEASLASHAVQTLVFIPDGSLRSIPMAALNNGREFLVTHYAVAVTPSLALTQQRSPTERHIHALIGGLTQSVLGFSPLPNVGAELKSVESIEGGKVLTDNDFIAGNVERMVSEEPYTLIHIATHAKFEGNAKESFLLTFDGKINMDLLEKMIAPSRQRLQGIDLLTLSACQTALGDDRAALGLAGIAIKAGARSALGSLWFINDESSSRLLAEFYGHLQPGISKAEALRQAQLVIMGQEQFHHPIYWAPFLMIGNWT